MNAQPNNNNGYCFQLLTKGPITLTEGGPGQYLDIEVPLSPSILSGLPSTEGLVFIETYFITVEHKGKQKETICRRPGAKRALLPQAVFGVPSNFENSWPLHCGAPVEDNGSNIIKVLVKAKYEGRKDGTKNRVLVVFQTIYDKVNMQIISRKELGRIDVGGI